MSRLRVHFRNAVHADKPAILKLFAAQLRSERQGGLDSALGSPYPQAFDDFITRCEQGDRRYQCVVAECDSEIVGYVRALHRRDSKAQQDILRPQARQTTLHKLVVAETFRGRGIGANLVRHVLNEAARQKRDIVRINLPAGNPLAFYKKLGFKTAGTLPGNKRKLDVIDLKVPRRA